MIKSQSAGGVIINPKGQVLVVSQHGTSWSLPKGTLEPGEDHKTAALREFEEETGITDVTFIKELGTYERYKIAKDVSEDKSEWKTITIYLCTTPEEELKPIDPENPEAHWVEPDKVADLLTHPKDIEFYRSVQPEVEGYIKKMAGLKYD
ncbi:MAG TPA: NUDIX domain-containing protein [Candidatus Saccharimonadales bacterium]|nr:NUDIX domain-containing protein [Candidatus Saccharimonadales bacterium]